MKRLTWTLLALCLGFTAACAEQPGKKKEEDTKSEAKTVDGKKVDAKPEVKPADAAPAPAPEAAPAPAPAPEAK
ncbi:hypothetical protein [Nannocystis bainbridge]|uniref:Lipoprotein n=1 Tax=Nannocystis bainbridge TaxID=2995303 RepID=A0ABT5DP36_9BACT|nr:hypothetical protein [Nannocystis bainbridge]MDC0715417.1 hypothetical protein [Nannocystis bainbridge]